MTIDPTEQDQIDFEKAAVKYAARGWRVLPVHPGEKRPVLNDWQRRATTELAQVFDWWIDNPRYNVGIATGVESGVFVLDVDPKNGGDESLTELEHLNKPLQRTYTVRTQSGGWHYYFRMPQDFVLTNSPGRLRGTGIDVRGEGGQVVAPPSVTPTGVYTLEVDAPLAHAPDWLLDLLRPIVALVPAAAPGPAVVPDDELEQVRGYVDRAVALAVQTVAETASGGRNQVLNDQVLSLAGIAAHDARLVSPDRLYRDMLAACSANGLINDDGLEAFRKTFDSAWNAGLAKPRRNWPPMIDNVRLLKPHTAPGAARPVVNVTERKLNELVDEILANIARSNDQAPEIFAHGSEIVRVVGQPAKTAVLDANMLAYEADARMDFEKATKGGVAVANAPARTVDTIMSLPEKPFPKLTRISYTPYFAPSGRLVTEPGYDAEAQTFYAPAPGLVVPDIAERPTREQALRALDYVDRELLHDFPFVGTADKAHALGLMLLPFVRDMIAGATPLHDIESPAPGSGKGLLMKVLLMPAVGGRQLTAGAAHEGAEWEKRLISFLRLSPQALVLDNVNDRVDSGFLCTALTEPEISSRVLGQSEQVTIPVRTVWVMTANNPKFSGEVARRTLRIRIDPGVERPEDRGGFRHSDLARWAYEHRANLIAACCTMIAGWVAAGCPELVPTKPLGSFEHWHAVMGGLLDFLGVEGLLENKEEFLTAGDDENSVWVALVHALRESSRLTGISEWTTNDVLRVVETNSIALDLGREGGSRVLYLGRSLGRQKDRWHDGAQFQKRLSNGKTWWQLKDQPRF